jgi:hypothetical protein
MPALQDELKFLARLLTKLRHQFRAQPAWKLAHRVSTTLARTSPVHSASSAQRVKNVELFTLAGKIARIGAEKCRYELARSLFMREHLLLAAALLRIACIVEGFVQRDREGDATGVPGKREREAAATPPESVDAPVAAPAKRTKPKSKESAARVRASDSVSVGEARLASAQARAEPASAAASSAGHDSAPSSATEAKPRETKKRKPQTGDKRAKTTARRLLSLDQAF